MARVQIKSENQHSRNESLGEQVSEFEKLSKEMITKRPGKKSWSVIEVVEHMNIAHKAYEEKIDSTLQQLGESSKAMTTTKAGGIPSFLIKRFPPKQGKIKFKMKTFKRFQPVFDLSNLSDEDIQTVFMNFQKSIDHINETIKNYPSKNVTAIKFPSAIGSSVKFNVAEACEFIICHNERHVQQIVNTLKKLRNA